MKYVLGVLTWCSVVAAKIGCIVASETSLRLSVLRHSICCVADEHAESLCETCTCQTCSRDGWNSWSLLTGLNAVTSPLPPET